MKPDTIIEFINSLPIEADSSVARRVPLRAGSPKSPQPSPVIGHEAIVVGSQLLEFSHAVGEGLREQVANLLLLAQLGANQAAPPATSTAAAWREAYQSILLRTGWVWEGTTVGMETVSQTDLDVHKAIIPVLTGILGNAAAASVVLAVLKGLEEMDKDAPWITLFHRETKRSSVSQFQVGFVDSEPGKAPRLTLVNFELNVEGEVTQVLFFKFSHGDASLLHGKTELSVPVDVFAELAAAVRLKVSAYIADFIAAIELGDLPMPDAVERSADLPPEKTRTTRAGSSSLSVEQAAQLEDVGAQPGPEDFMSERATRAAPNLSLVTWPSNDSSCPDYAYVSDLEGSQNFILNADSLEALIAANRYVPSRESGVIAFALRGARLANGHEVEKEDNVHLVDTRPDHRKFQCVVGFYHTAARKITAFTGSTVPCRLAIYSYKNGGSRSNMLPTGCYTYYIWRHKDIWPALRLAASQVNLEAGSAATVLRNTNDYKIEVTDPFSYSTPHDNVHCAYYTEEDSRLGASFSSWGCLTVRGTRTPSDQWRKFQAVLTGLGQKTRVDLVLATGKDCALAANAADKPRLEALRHGSRGEEVLRLQQKLGIDATGFYGASTLDKFTAAQRKFNADAGLGRVADGLYTRALEARTGWGVFV